MTSFKPLNIRIYQREGQIVTPDSIYWERLGQPQLLKEQSSIDYIDFSTSDPDNFALTCSVRVQIYNVVTRLVVKNLSRFQKTAYGAKFRQDGRLLAAGDEEGHVKVFDTTTRQILRLFKGHKAAVHRTFFTADKEMIASFADDRAIRLWDVGNEKCVQTYDNAHGDYIRAGAVHPHAANIFVSGGYDGKINVYDTRTETPVMHTLDHGSPVESMVFLPAGSVFISAGGTQVRVWDMINGSRLLTTMSQHHKTITCLALGSDGRRLFSGGLDRHIKIYDVNSYKTVHTLTYPNDVLSVAVADNDQAVVAGMVDGLVSIKTMTVDTKPRHLKKIRARYQRQRHVPAPPPPPIAVDHVVKSSAKKPKLLVYDQYLRTYNYRRALDSVFTQEFIVRQPEITVMVINELLHRDGLSTALTGRPEGTVVRFITFLCTNMGEMRFMRTLLKAASVLIEVYEQSTLTYSKNLLNAFQRLLKAMRAEIRLTTQILHLKGALEMMVGASVDGSKLANVEPRKPRLQPSKAAESYVVIADCQATASK